MPQSRDMNNFIRNSIDSQQEKSRNEFCHALAALLRLDGVAR